VPVLGRKNYLFCGSDAGGKRAACIYTTLETARMNDVNPQAYLADVLRALTSGNDDDVAIAQVYLRHRPIAGVDEQRQLAAAVARMPPSDAQVRAIDTLARLRIADPESLVELARLYRQARSVATQRAIAGVLIRADYPQPERADLARSLRVHRVKSPDSDDVIDALLRRLQAAQAP